MYKSTFSFLLFFFFKDHMVIKFKNLEEQLKKAKEVSMS